MYVLVVHIISEASQKKNHKAIMDLCSTYADNVQNVKRLLLDIIKLILLCQDVYTKQQLSRDARKPVIESSDQARHKPACTVTESG